MNLFLNQIKTSKKKKRIKKKKKIQSAFNILGPFKDGSSMNRLVSSIPYINKNLTYYRPTGSGENFQTPRQKDELTHLDSR